MNIDFGLDRLFWLLALAGVVFFFMIPGEKRPSRPLRYEVGSKVYLCPAGTVFNPEKRICYVKASELKQKHRKEQGK